MRSPAVALPKRLLRIKRQTARLAEMRCIRAAAQLEQAVQAERSGQRLLDDAEASLRERCLRMRLVEEVHASRHEIQRLTERVQQLQIAAAEARQAYQSAMAEQQKAEAEVEVLEKLLQQRLDELRHKAEQRKQQFADEWTMRRWNGGDADRQESSR
ncbi:MAG: hypothetical protein JNG89_02010 [Planctomycetaceae bacterium]|nr:hypothetical protein [Planctomycetaceae bacterium]